MALRFRTRLNLTIAALVFLVVTTMTLVVLSIFAFDLWRQGWNQGRVLTEVTTRNIDYGLGLPERARATLQDQLRVQGLLVAELVAMAEASADLTDADVAEAVERVVEGSTDHRGDAAIGGVTVTGRDGRPAIVAGAGAARPDAAFQNTVPVPGLDGARVVHIDASADLVAVALADYAPQGLLDRFMIDELYRAMAIIDRDGNVVAQTGDVNFISGPGPRRRIIAFCRGFLRDMPEDLYATTIVGARDLGVVTPLQARDGVYTHALFVLHDTSSQFVFILDRIGVLVTVGFILFLVALVVSIFLSRGLTKPLIELARGAREFGAGNLSYRLRMRRKDEFNDLAQSFNTMAISIQEYVHELEQETSRRERLESEFRIAAELQRTLLPEGPPLIEGLRLVGWSQPSKEVGGDFYDFVEMGDGRVAVMLGDATGKGLSAALLSTQCASVLRTLAGRNLSASDLLYQTNNEFYKRIGSTHRFVTLFLLIIDTTTGRATYASAGHPPPVLINSESGVARWLESEAGYPLGIVNEATFSEADLVLDRRDTIVIYSDGLTDAQNHARELYGEERVEKILRTIVGASSEDLLADLREDAVRHMDGKEPIDDMTIVVVRFHPLVRAEVRPASP